MPSAIRKVLITGCSGYIGSLLSAEFSRHYEVIGLTRKKEDAAACYKSIQCDLGCDPLPDFKMDAIVHLASKNDKDCEADPIGAVKTNVLGTLKLLESAKKNSVKKFVFISTGICGFSDQIITEDCVPNLTTMYWLTKYIAEKLCFDHSESMSICVLRYFYPYGPGTDPQRMIARIINNINSGKKVDLKKDGKPITNPVYISDLVEITRLAMEYEGKPFEKFNVAGEDKASIEQIAMIIGHELGRTPEYNMIDKEEKDMIADISRVKNVLGYRYKYPLRVGINETVASLRSGRQ
jgi:nucleoside-diphosphate-sugar epimerase